MKRQINNKMRKEYSKLLMYRFGLLITLILFFSSCSREYDKRYQQLRKEFKEIYDVRLPKKVKRIYIINDNYCPVCVTHFSEYVLTKINEDDKNILCFVNSEGLHVDIARFREIGGKNVYLNNRIIPYDDEGLIPPALGVIFLHENKIDTIVSVDSQTILTQLEYIDSKSE